MFDFLTQWLSRRSHGLRVAVVTPVGPGHAALYEECRASVERAWHAGRGPFSALDLIDVDDAGGRLGRSRARNIGIDRAVGKGADWLFFLDADDLMVAGAFEAMTALVADHDAVWGMILGLAPGAAGAHLRIPQIVGMDRFDDLLLFDPFLTLQMGHFVRTPVAAALRFDEVLDAGEDFDYYLRVWAAYRCVKVPREFFINRHARHSSGPRAATAADWGAAVRGRQQAERLQHRFDPDSAAALELRDRRTAELHRFCRLQGLVSAGDCAALSQQMPFSGEIELNEYQGGSLFLRVQGDDAICARLAWTGEYQPFATALWQSLLANGGTVLDIGAGNGLYALLAARVAAKTRIVCFEPAAANAARLRVNIRRNGSDNIELIETLPPDLDAHLNAGAIAGVTAVRIAGHDVLAVLRSMEKTLVASRPDFLVELPGNIAAAFTQWMERHHYRCYVVDDGERELRRCDPARVPGADAALLVLASKRSADELAKVARNALGRLVAA